MAVDSEIIDAAKARGYAQAQVFRHTVSERSAYNGDDGVWFCLAVKCTAASEWEVIGRRRTKAELLVMVNAREAI